jgi:hypothetical protein
VEIFKNIFSKAIQRHLPQLNWVKAPLIFENNFTFGKKAMFQFGDYDLCGEYLFLYISVHVTICLPIFISILAVCEPLSYNSQLLVRFCDISGGCPSGLPGKLTVVSEVRA